MSKEELIKEVYYKLIVISFDIDECVNHETLKENVVEVLELIEENKKSENE